MDENVKIYVSLLGENVDVWRPVFAEKIADFKYRISAQDYLSDIETWQFIPGDIVNCGFVNSSGGPILAALSKVTE